jgi:hypothetical protein
MSPLLFSSLRQAVRPALRQRVRFNSSKPPPAPEKKAQEVIANAQKSAGQLWESATKKAEEVVGCVSLAQRTVPMLKRDSLAPETISKNAEKLSKSAGQLWSSAKTTLGPAAEKAEVLVGCTRDCT